MKDNFSSQSDHYRRFRPAYPKELVQLINELAPGKNSAWDVGTGNGQLAVMLSEVFEAVHATDISEKQLSNATQKPNIWYSKQPAESTSFASNQFDLVTVAQAIHWFDFDAFYAEARRTLKQGGVMAVIGYGLLRINEEIDSIIDDFYEGIVGPYWDPERRYIDEKYASIPFPFQELHQKPQIKLVSELSLEDLLGYLRSWSAVQHYKKENGDNPIDLIAGRLKEVWKSGKFKAIHPCFMRVGVNV